MFGKLAALVGGGPALPFSVDGGGGDALTAASPFSSPAWGCWTHLRGTWRDDGAKVSVFRFVAPDERDPRLPCVRNGVRRLKMVRGERGAAS